MHIYSKITCTPYYKILGNKAEVYMYLSDEHVLKLYHTSCSGRRSAMDPSLAVSDFFAF